MSLRVTVHQFLLDHQIAGCLSDDFADRGGHEARQGTKNAELTSLIMRAHDHTREQYHTEAGDFTEGH